MNTEKIEEIAETITRRSYNLTAAHCALREWNDLEDGGKSNYTTFARFLLTEAAKLKAEVGTWVKVSDRLPSAADFNSGNSLALVMYIGGAYDVTHYTNVAARIHERWMTIPTPPSVEPERDECLEKAIEQYGVEPTEPTTKAHWEQKVQAFRHGFNASRESLAGKGEGA